MTPLLPTSCCPVCRYEMDSAHAPGHPLKEPKSGDIAICLNCGETLQYNDILVLKPVSTISNLQLGEEQEAMLMEAVLLIKQRGRFR